MPHIPKKDRLAFNKFVAEYQAEKFRQKEFKQRLNTLLIIAIPLLLIVMAEVVGYYWGN